MENISNLHPEILKDESSLTGGFCSKVYWPCSFEEVAELLLNQIKTTEAVTISGARTGITGGSVPFGGIAISTEKLKGIKETSKNSIIAVKAGETLDTIKKFCQQNKQNYFYPPDPTETTASIGGTIATDASGASSYLYGSTRKWINRLKIILPSGTKLDIKRGDFFFKNSILSHPILGFLSLPVLKKEQPPKNAAGLFIKPNMDLIDLFIGSEGKLGIIIEAELILHKKPYLTASFAVFCNENQFWNLRKELLKTKLRVRELEAIVPPSLQFLTKNTNKSFPNTGEWVLMTSLELFSENDIDSALESLDTLFSKLAISPNAVWAALSSLERKQLKEFRHLLPETVNRIVALNSSRNPHIHKISTDTAVSPELLQQYYLFMNETLINSGVEFVLFGHAGQGHLHANLLPDTTEKLKISEKTAKLIAEKAILLGGTVSAEHGTGKLKHNLLGIMYSQKELAQIKKIITHLSNIK